MVLKIKKKIWTLLRQFFDYFTRLLFYSFWFLSSFDNNVGWGDHLLSLEFSEICEIDLFLLHLTRGRRLRTALRVLPKYYTLNPKFHFLN